MQLRNNRLSLVVLGGQGQGIRDQQTLVNHYGTVVSDSNRVGNYIAGLRLEGIQAFSDGLLSPLDRGDRLPGLHTLDGIHHRRRIIAGNLGGHNVFQFLIRIRYRVFIDHGSGRTHGQFVLQRHGRSRLYGAAILQSPGEGIREYRPSGDRNSADILHGDSVGQLIAGQHSHPFGNRDLFSVAHNLRQRLGQLDGFEVIDKFRLFVILSILVSIIQDDADCSEAIISQRNLDGLLCYIVLIVVLHVVVVQAFRNNFNNIELQCLRQDVMAIFVNHVILIVLKRFKFDFSVRGVGDRLHFDRFRFRIIGILHHQLEGELAFAQSLTLQGLLCVNFGIALGVIDIGEFSNCLVLAAIIHLHIQGAILVVRDGHINIRQNRVRHTLDVSAFRDGVLVGLADILLSVGNRSKGEVRHCSIRGMDGNHRGLRQRIIGFFRVQGENPFVLFLIVTAGDHLDRINDSFTFRRINVGEQNSIIFILMLHIQRTGMGVGHRYGRMQNMIIIVHAFIGIFGLDFGDVILVDPGLGILNLAKTECFVLRHRRSTIRFFLRQRSIRRLGICFNLEAVALAIHPHPAGQLLFAAQHDGVGVNTVNVDIRGCVTRLRFITVGLVRFDFTFLQIGGHGIIFFFRSFPNHGIRNGLQHGVIRTHRQVFQQDAFTVSELEGEDLVIGRLHAFRPGCNQGRGRLAQFDLEIELCVLIRLEGFIRHLDGLFHQQAAYVPGVGELGIVFLHFVLDVMIEQNDFQMITYTIGTINRHTDFVGVGVIGHFPIGPGIVHHLVQGIGIHTNIIKRDLGFNGFR